MGGILLWHRLRGLLCAAAHRLLQQLVLVVGIIGWAAKVAAPSGCRCGYWSAPVWSNRRSLIGYESSPYRPVRL